MQTRVLFSSKARTYSLLYGDHFDQRSPWQGLVGDAEHKHVAMARAQGFGFGKRAVGDALRHQDPRED